MFIYIFVVILIILIYIRCIREKFIGELPTGAPSQTTANPASAITLSYAQDTQSLKAPDQLCFGADRCISADMIANLKQPAKCDLFLWDALNNYRDYSTVWNNAEGTRNGKWRLNSTAADRNWAQGFLAGPYGYGCAQSEAANSWQIIYTDPNLSQRVAGLRMLTRPDRSGNYGIEMVKTFFISYMPMTGTVEAIVPNPADPTNMYKGITGGVDIFFPSVVECKYIKITVISFTSSPSYRSGLYLCL